MRKKQKSGDFVPIRISVKKNMEKISYVWMSSGVFLLLLFVVPLFRSVKGNIGTVTGVILALLLFAYGAFMPKVHKLIGAVSQYVVGRILLGVLILLGAAVLAAAVTETVWIIRAACRKPAEHGLPAVVLGCKVRGNKATRVLLERLQAAYDYLQEEPEAVAILSGGKGEDEEISEAACMYEYLTARGIDPKRLILEDASANTRENLAFSKKILQQEQLGSKITIITSEFHEYRANETAKKLGLESFSTPAYTNFWYFPTYYVRELYGILYYKRING